MPNKPNKPNKPQTPQPAAPVGYATLARELLLPLRELHYQHPDLPLAKLAGTIAELLELCRQRKLLDATPAKLTPKLEAALGERLADAIAAAAAALDDEAAAAAQPGGKRVHSELREIHPVISVSTTAGSHYSFGSVYQELVGKRTVTAVGLTTIDSDGKVFPTLGLDKHLRTRVLRAERIMATCTPHLLSDPPEALLSAAGLEDALDRLRSGFPAALPFRSALHERRFRVWCMMTYLFPLMDSTPFLRVRVPDIYSARNVQRLLEVCCFNAIGVARAGMKSLVNRHRDAFAGATIFSPELRTGRLPAAALGLLEMTPLGERREPPVAYVEVWDETRSPRVPEEWIIDVELGGRVPVVTLPDDYRHLGCAVALARGGGLLATAPTTEGAAGLSRWLQELLYGGLLSDAELDSDAAAVEQSLGFPVAESDLASYAEQVWAECLQDTPEASEESEADGATKAKQLQCRHCSPTCLRQRMAAQIPQARKLLESKGYQHHFARRIIEQGVATYSIKHMKGCLSPVKCADWSREHRGFEVPLRRLPGNVSF